MSYGHDDMYSNLADPAYGYDFVVAVTGGYINTQVNSGFDYPGQPDAVCYINDENGNHKPPINLADLLKLTNGINPFELSPNTSPDDPQLKELARVGFSHGIEYVVGLPSGVDGADLFPPWVALGDSPSQVGLNMYFSTLVVAQYTAAVGSQSASWMLSDQSQNRVYLAAPVNLVTTPLNSDLDTIYFNNNPQKKSMIQGRLKQIPSGVTYNLLQLLLGVSGPNVPQEPTVYGIDSLSVAAIVQDNASDLFPAAIEASDFDQVPIAVMACTQSVGSLPAAPRQVETFVSPVLDANGQPIVISTLSEAQQKIVQPAITLNMVCSCGTAPMQPPKPFPWNWVQPVQNLDDLPNGVMAVSRRFFGELFFQEMLPSIKANCLQPVLTIYDPFDDTSLTSSCDVSFSPGSPGIGTMITHNDTGSIEMLCNWNMSFPSVSSVTTGTLGYSYQCTVTFQSNYVLMTESLGIFLDTTTQVSSTTSEATNVMVKSLTNESVYLMSMDDDTGKVLYTLDTDPNASRSTDNSESVDVFVKQGIFDQRSMTNLTNTVNAAIKPYPARMTRFVPANAPNFIFPGSDNFSFTNVKFSWTADLICQIQGTGPSEQQTPSVQNKVPGAEIVSPSTSQTKLVSEDMTATIQESHRAISNGTVIGAGAVPVSNEVTATTPTLTVNSSSQMMTNYVGGSVASAGSKFEALQIAGGFGLVLSINSKGALVAYVEVSGISKAGWLSHELSAGVLKNDFPNDSNAIVATFDVAQSTQDGTICIAMAISSGGSHHLYVSVGNSHSDTSWLLSPSWRYKAYDAETAISPLVIVGTNFSEIYTPNGGSSQQWLVVDVLRDPNSGSQDISRYYIDWLQSSGPTWAAHQIGFDVEAGSYKSQVGRAYTNQPLDGLYTMGFAATSGQLVYQPFINVNGPGSAPLSKLYLTQDDSVFATAIVAVRDDTPGPTSGTTGLYAIGGSTLYYFAANNQRNRAVATELGQWDVLLGTTELFAMASTDATTGQSTVTLWGKNSSGQVYYTTCPTDAVASGSSWSPPIAILSGMIHISPYMNLADGGNTIFAIGADDLEICTQATNTTHKMWTSHKILLESDVPTPTATNSYTTRVEVVNANNVPAPNTPVTLTTVSRLPVYINGVYHVLGPSATIVNTNNWGEMTIMEPTPDINGTVITVVVNGVTTQINPMHDSFKMITGLNTQTALSGASMYTDTIAGGYRDGATKTALIDSSGNPNYQDLATRLASLNTAYDSVTTDTPASSTAQARRVATAHAGSAAQVKLGGWLSHAWGDVCNVAKAAVNEGKQVVSDVKQIPGEIEHEGKKIWVKVVNFTITIGKDVYSGILDTVGSIVSGIQWVFNEVKTGIDKIAAWIRALFPWSAIERTKNVFSKVTSLYVDNATTSIATAQASFDSAITTAADKVAAWSTTTQDWNNLGTPATKTASQSGSDPRQGQTAHSQFLANHYQNQAGNLTITGSLDGGTSIDDLVNTLLDKMNEEIDLFHDAYENIKSLAKQIDSLSVKDLLTKLLGILTDTVLLATKDAIDALFAILISLTDALSALLNVTIHIPIISDILSDIGVAEVKFMDLFHWIIAASYTIVYEVTHQVYPFLDDATTTAITDVSTWSDLSGNPALDPARPKVFIAGHTSSGGVGLIESFVSVAEAQGDPDNSYATPDAVLCAIMAAAKAGANMIAPQCPLQDAGAKVVLEICTLASLMNKAIFSNPAQKKLSVAKSVWKNLAVSDARSAGAVVDALLVIPQLACTCVHLSELSMNTKAFGTDPWTAAILEELGNLFTYVGTVGYAGAVADTEEITKEIVTAVMGLAKEAAAALQVGEGLITVTQSDDAT